MRYSQQKYIALWTFIQLGVLRSSLRPDLYETLSLGRVVHSTDPCPDVYSYNFPNDRRSVKFLGAPLNASEALLTSESRRISISLFRVRTGDCPNGTDWVRRPLLVS